MKTKQVKRSEAIERQAAHDKLSVADKIYKLDIGKFVAKKERKKLCKNIK